MSDFAPPIDAATESIINLWAPFPHARLEWPSHVHSSNWSYRHVLVVPTAEVNARGYSRRPWKWLRFAVGVVLGVEGYLSASIDPNDSDAFVDDSAPTLPVTAGKVAIYFHVSTEEMARMVAIDVHFNHPHWQTAAGRAARRLNDFCQRVVDRDLVCVITGTEEGGCEACHIVPHGKGDKYIEHFTRCRSRNPADDVVCMTEDTRNGLLAEKACNSMLGRTLGILRTPNFAMLSSDVDQAASEPDSERFTAHTFSDVNPTTQARSFGSTQASYLGRPVHLPQSPYQQEARPTAALIDGCYASCIVRCYGSPALKDACEVFSGDYYPGGRKRKHEAEADERKRIDENKQATVAKANAARTARLDERQQAKNVEAVDLLHGHPDVPFDMDDFDLLHIPYVFMREDGQGGLQTIMSQQKSESGSSSKSRDGEGCLVEETTSPSLSSTASLPNMLSKSSFTVASPSLLFHLSPSPSLPSSPTFAVAAA